MTLIECFDRCVADNIIGCVHIRPNKVIFLGEAELLQTSIRRYEEFFAACGLTVDVQQRAVEMDKISCIAAALTDIVEQEETCVIDVTGGDERLLVAVGMVMAELKPEQRQRISVQKFDSTTGVVQDCDEDGQYRLGHPVRVTVENLVKLYGGIVHPKSFQPGNTALPRDLEPLWKIATRYDKDWNQMVAALELFESRADSRNQVFLYLPSIRGGIPNFEENRELVMDLLNQFEKYGIIINESRGDILEYRYATPLYRYCTLKVGNLLEVKTLLEARAMTRDGRDFFQDCQMGVHIDWDGVVYDIPQRVPETRNEIDVLLTRGVTPLFISCKNGDVDEDELFKLHTVATRFGGENAKKMLVATHLQKKNHISTQAFIQRAKDMDIHLVTNAGRLTAKEWQEALAKPFL